MIVCSLWTFESAKRCCFYKYSWSDYAVGENSVLYKGLFCCMRSINMSEVHIRVHYSSRQHRNFKFLQNYIRGFHVIGCFQPCSVFLDWTPLFLSCSLVLGHFKLYSKF